MNQMCKLAHLYHPVILSKFMQMCFLGFVFQKVLH